jgi:hypothetical protein
MQFSIFIEISHFLRFYERAYKQELKIIRRCLFCVCVIVVVVVVVDDEWGSGCQNIERWGCQCQGQTDVVHTVLFNIKYYMLYTKWPLLHYKGCN